MCLIVLEGSLLLNVEKNFHNAMFDHMFVTHM